MNYYSKVFKQNKNLPLDKFIKKALYDEDYGFYTRKNPFGLKGDFIQSIYLTSTMGISYKVGAK